MTDSDHEKVRLDRNRGPSNRTGYMDDRG
jgi:hypothetical protein